MKNGFPRRALVKKRKNVWGFRRKTIVFSFLDGLIVIEKIR